MPAGAKVQLPLQQVADEVRERPDLAVGTFLPALVELPGERAGHPLRAALERIQEAGGIAPELAVVLGVKRPTVPGRLAAARARLRAVA